MFAKLKDMGWLAVALVAFGGLCTLGVDAFFRELEREDKIKECMYERSACEYARCASIVDDVPMTEEASNACP
jgi:hypothetical protein